MKKGVVNELISTMREVTPKEGNLANILMDILCMSMQLLVNIRYCFKVGRMLYYLYTIYKRIVQNYIYGGLYEKNY